MVRKIFFYQGIILALFLLIFGQKAYANNIDDIISNSGNLQKAVIGISVKELHSGKVLYQKNQNTFVHPASTLKLITSAAAYDYLGSEYFFKTGIYKNRGKIYFKVGADPLFEYSDMLNLISQYKNKNTEPILKFYIDDSIIDKEPYGIGWQWDDNTNVHFPQTSPYTINQNLCMLKASLNDKNKVQIEFPNEYKEPVTNNLTHGEKTLVTTKRNIFKNNAPIILNGTINKTSIIKVPAKSPEQLYLNVLRIALVMHDVAINSQIGYAKVPQFSVEEAIIARNINDVLKEINQNSNNLAAELLIKHTGAAKTGEQGTTKAGLDVIKQYYLQKNVNIKDTILVDASGASMNDYVTANFMTDALIAISKSPNFSTIKNSLTDNNIGTFQNRLNELNGKIKVKTGTNANTSAVIGYLKAADNKDLVFSIIIDNIPKSATPKELENKIIKAIYTNSF